MKKDIKYKEQSSFKSMILGITIFNDANVQIKFQCRQPQKKLCALESKFRILKQLIKSLVMMPNLDLGTKHSQKTNQKSTRRKVFSIGNPHYQCYQMNKLKNINGKIEYVSVITEKVFLK